MNTDLRDLMARVADDVEPVPVAPDIWRRARRARTRDRALLSALVTMLVLGGVAVGLRPSLLPAPLDPVDRPVVGGAGAVPDRIYHLPDGYDEPLNPDWPRRPEPADSVGRASATLVDEAGDVVLVSAVDGEHHLVRLPGFYRFAAADENQRPLAVSPDGTRLAYAWRADERPTGRRWPSGLAVLHLDEPGRTDVHRLPGGDGVITGGFSWSPGGRWLTYAVDELERMRENGATYGPTRVERLHLDSGGRVVVGPASQHETPSVSDDGVILLTDDGLELWSAGQRLGVATDDPLVRNYGPSAWSSDDRRVAVTGPGRVDTVTVVDAASLQAREVELDKPAPTTVRGWVGPDHVLLTRRVVPFDRTDLVLVDVEGGSTRTVGAAGAGVPDTLSIAAGLMTLERPTAEFAPPSWLPVERWWTRWVGTVGGLVLLAGLVVAWRRSQRADRRRRVPGAYPQS